MGYERPTKCTNSPDCSQIMESWCVWDHTHSTSSIGLHLIRCQYRSAVMLCVLYRQDTNTSPTQLVGMCCALVSVNCSRSHSSSLSLPPFHNMNCKESSTLPTQHLVQVHASAYQIVQQSCLCVVVAVCMYLGAQSHLHEISAQIYSTKYYNDLLLDMGCTGSNPY